MFLRKKSLNQKLFSLMKMSFRGGQMGVHTSLYITTTYKKAIYAVHPCDLGMDSVTVCSIKSYGSCPYLPPLPENKLKLFCELVTAGICAHISAVTIYILLLYIYIIGMDKGCKLLQYIELQCPYLCPPLFGIVCKLL